MASDDKYIAILEKISEVSVQTGRIDQRCDFIEKELTQIHTEDQRTNKLLEEHMLNTKTNTDRLSLEIETRKEQSDKAEREKESMDKRLESLEKYPQFFKSVKTIALFVSAIGGAIIIVSKAMGLW